METAVISQGEVIFYIRMKFQSNLISLSKVIESSSYFSHAYSKVKAHYEKRRPATGLRGLCLIHLLTSVLVQNFLKEEKVVQLFHPPYLPDFSLCDFFLFPLLKKTLSGPSCSKLTTSLVNDSLKFTSNDTQIC